MNDVPKWFRLLYDLLEKGKLSREQEVRILAMIRDYFDSDDDHARDLYSHAVSVITFPNRGEAAPVRHIPSPAERRGSPR